MTALQKKEKLMFNDLLSDLKIPHYSIYVGKVLKRNILSNTIIYYTKLCHISPDPVWRINDRLFTE